MKYWRGYLAAVIFAAITWGLSQFAQAHNVLVDMIYPYVTRNFINSLADWSAGISICLWQVVIAGLLVLLGVSVFFVIRKRWNVVQWLGWVLAVVTLIAMLQTGMYGLNKYTSPLADDVRLQVTDYTVTELNDAATYFRDKANALAEEITRDKKGKPDFGKFKDLAQQAGEGFEYLTYEEAMSVFSGSTAPVKKLGFAFLTRDTGVTVALTGEACVNPNVPTVILPFAMCKEMAHRMNVYTDIDAQYAAFLAGTANSSKAFQYSAYLFAYQSCYEALSNVPTATAKACAQQVDAGVNQQLRQDLKDYTKYFGKNSNAEASRVRTADSEQATSRDTVATITYSEYTGVADLLASWYVQEFVTPLHAEEELPFNPLSPSDVDLTNIGTVANEPDA